VGREEKSGRVEREGFCGHMGREVFPRGLHESGAVIARKSRNIVEMVFFFPNDGRGMEDIVIFP